MRVLLKSLPLDAATRQKDPNTPWWGNTEELLALLIEEVSVLTSERRRKEPLQIPRPGVQDRHPPGSVGIEQMVERMAAAGRVRVVQDGDTAGS